MHNGVTYLGCACNSMLAHPIYMYMYMYTLCLPYICLVLYTTSYLPCVVLSYMYCLVYYLIFALCYIVLYTYMYMYYLIHVFALSDIPLKQDTRALRPSVARLALAG